MKKKKVMAAFALMTALSMVQLPVMASNSIVANEEAHITVNEEAQVESAGWHKDSYGWWYEDENGEYPTNCLKAIDGTYYGFNSNGYMVTGWAYIEDAWRFFNKSGSIISEGWSYIDGEYYHFFNQSYDNGPVKTCLERNIVVDNEYYVNDNGVWIDTPGWVYCDLGSGSEYNYWMYIKDNGHIAHDTWKYIDGKYYYFGSNGNMCVNGQVEGYLLGADGVLVKKPGWHAIKCLQYSFTYDWTWYYVLDNEKVFGYNENFGNYAWKYIDGKYYCFNSSGEMQTANVFEDGSFVGNDGAWDTKPGWKKCKYHDFREVRQVWFYVDSNGKGARNTWKNIAGKSYYFDKHGMMATDTYIDGYYVDENGVWIP